MADGDQPEPKGAPARPGGPVDHGSAIRPVRLEGLLLLGTPGNQPMHIDRLSFAGDGISVIRAAGEEARVLPWSAVIRCVVERWEGGVVPEWWIDPELAGSGPGLADGAVTDPAATVRSVPHAGAGAVIGVQTADGTFRFVVPDGDPAALSRQVDSFTLRYGGTAAVSSVTRVVAWGEDAERRKSVRPPTGPTGWARARPYLVVAMIVVVALSATLILLQSAGAIHLPLLGGPGSGPGQALRTG